MKLLGAVLYDPATAVSVGSAASVLAAFDTTNARIAFTIPSHGMVRVRVGVTIHGATTYSQIVLGVLEGATLRGRVVPTTVQNGTALAVTQLRAIADYCITGLTPGAVNWDAAWGIEQFVASSLLKYGGPNNTTANDAFGALQFEVWDPAPQPTNYSVLSIDANGRVDVVKVNGTSQTARDLGGQLDATVSSRSTFAGGAVASVTADVGITQAGADKVWSSAARTLTSFGTLIADIWASTTRTLTAGTNIVLAKGVGVSGLNDLDAAGVRSAIGMAAANLDGQLSVLDSDVLSRLAASSYTAPDNTRPAHFTSLAIAADGVVSADIKKVNAITVNGDGAATPWGP